MRILATMLWAMAALCLPAQINDFETEKFEITEDGVMVLSMDYSPDGRPCAARKGHRSTE